MKIKESKRYNRIYIFYFSFEEKCLNEAIMVFNGNPLKENTSISFWFPLLCVIGLPILMEEFIRSAELLKQASDRPYIFLNDFMRNKNLNKTIEITKRNRRNSILTLAFVFFFTPANNRKSLDKTSQYWKRCDYLHH